MLPVLAGGTALSLPAGQAIPQASVRHGLRQGFKHSYENDSRIRQQGSRQPYTV